MSWLSFFLLNSGLMTMFDQVPGILMYCLWRGISWLACSLLKQIHKFFHNLTLVDVYLKGLADVVNDGSENVWVGEAEHMGQKCYVKFLKGYGYFCWVLYILILNTTI